MATEWEVRVAVEEILASVLYESPESLRAHPALACHKWDSVAVMESFVRLEKSLSIRLDLRAFRAARTVDDVVGLVSQIAR